MPKLTYKTLTPDDAAAWQALRIEGARDFPLGFMVTLDEVTAATPDHCRDRLRGGAMRGLFDGAALIGYCGFHRQTLQQVQHRAEIGPFFIAAPYQGSGAAQALMAGAVAEARALGLAQLELFVDTTNPRAIAFYEKQGFARVATHRDTVRINGRSHDDHFMTLRL